MVRKEEKAHIRSAGNKIVYIQGQGRMGRKRGRNVACLTLFRLMIDRSDPLIIIDGYS